MAVNPETLGNFSNPVVPKAPKASRISMGDLAQASQDSADLYKAEGEAAVKKSMGEAQATRDAAYQTADIQRAAREPVLKELSTVSKGIEFKPSQETFIGMSSLAGLIAFIGTAAGQYGARSGKAAIDSMTGMMKGYQTGRQDVFRREQIQFEKEMASLKATQERLYKELDQADKTALIDSAKASADRAVAIAASGSDFLKASYNTKGARGVKDDLFKFMDAQQKADTMAQNLGIARDKLAQDRDIAMMKAAGATTGQIPKDKETNNQYLGRKNVINNINEIQTLLKDPQFSRLIGPETQFTPDIFNNLRTNFPQLSAKLARIQAIEFELGGKNLTKNEIDILRPIYSWKGITAGALNERLKLVKEDFADRNAIIEIRFPGLAPVGQKIDDYYKKGRSITEVSEIGGAESSDKYVTGKVYTDDSGNKAKYLGNGNWEDQ
jgi:hypothetical protein